MTDTMSRPHYQVDKEHRTPADESSLVAAAAAASAAVLGAAAAAAARITA